LHRPIDPPGKYHDHKTGSSPTREPIPLSTVVRLPLQQSCHHRANSVGLARFSRPAIPVIQLSKYDPGTTPDLDKTHRALSALKAHKRTTVLLQDRCNFYVLYETDKNDRNQDRYPDVN